ncbi:MAG: hypothetical protein LH606_11480 [Cytophagaceae bacterium]|nr:hypothetical protein [Cytophagaceae bacterium]
MNTHQIAQTYLDRLNATTTEVERRAVAAEFHAYYATLSPEEKQEAKSLFTPVLNALKERIAEVEEEVEALFKRRLQTHA